MGRPKGAENKDKPWRAAIRKAVHELRPVGDDKADKVKALGLLADRLVTKGLDGDIAAIREIGDRLDGKAVQGVGLDVAVTVTAIERTIVDPVDPKLAGESRTLIDGKPMDAE